MLIVVLHYHIIDNDHGPPLVFPPFASLLKKDCQSRTSTFGFLVLNLRDYLCLKICFHLIFFRPRVQMTVDSRSLFLVVGIPDS